MTAPSLVKFRDVLLFLMLIASAGAIVLMVDSYEYGPICLYMVRGHSLLDRPATRLSLSAQPSNLRPATSSPQVAHPLWMLGAYRIVLEKCFGWDVRVFMGHLAIPLATTSLTGFLWFFVWFESSDDNQVCYTTGTP